MKFESSLFGRSNAIWKWTRGNSRPFVWGLLRGIRAILPVVIQKANCKMVVSSPEKKYYLVIAQVNGEPHFWGDLSKQILPEKQLSWLKQQNKTLLWHFIQVLRRQFHKLMGDHNFTAPVQADFAPHRLLQILSFMEQELNVERANKNTDIYPSYLPCMGSFPSSTHSV